MTDKICISENKYVKLTYDSNPQMLGLDDIIEFLTWFNITASEIYDFDENYGLDGCFELYVKSVNGAVLIKDI